MAFRIPHPFPAHLALALLFAASGLTWGTWIARIPGIADHLELTRAELGAILPAFSVGALISFPIAAATISRFGTRNAVRIFGVMRGATFPLLALAPTAPVLLVSLVISGFMHGALDVSLNAQGVEIERRTFGSILSRAHGSFSLGALVGSLGAGLAAQFGAPLASQFMLPAMIVVTMFALLGHRLIDDEAPGAISPAPASKRKWRGVGVPPRALWALGAIAFVTSITDEAVADWSALFIQQDLEATPLVASLAYALYSLALVIGRFSGDSVSRRFAPMSLLQAGGAMGGIGLLIGTTFNTSIAMLIGLAIVGLGFSVIYPIIYRMAGNTPGIARGKAMATMATIAYLGYLAGPLLIGPLSGATSLRAALMVVGISCFAIPLIGWLRQSWPTKTEVPAAIPSFEPETAPEPNAYSL